MINKGFPTIQSVFLSSTNTADSDEMASQSMGGSLGSREFVDGNLPARTSPNLLEPRPQHDSNNI